jgi:hypothetical protein
MPAFEKYPGSRERSDVPTPVEYPEDREMPGVAPVLPTPEIDRHKRPAAGWDGDTYDRLRDERGNPTGENRKLNGSYSEPYVGIRKISREPRTETDDSLELISEIPNMNF